MSILWESRCLEPYRHKVLKNSGERICCHEKSKNHKAAAITLSTIRMDNNLGNNTAKESDLSGERSKTNTLCISKLITVVYFLAWNNLPVKSTLQSTLWRTVIMNKTFVNFITF